LAAASAVAVGVVAGAVAYITYRAYSGHRVGDLSYVYSLPAEKRSRLLPARLSRTPSSRNVMEFTTSEDGEKVPLSCPTYTICRMRHIDKVIVREYIGVDSVNGAPLVEGFASIGMSSALAAGYLVEALNLPQVADIVSDDFPALGVVTQYKMGSGCRIYGDSRLAVIVSDFKIADSNPILQRSLVAAIYDFAYRHECKFMVTVEGLRDNDDEESGGLEGVPEPGGEDDEDGGDRKSQQPLKVKLDLSSDQKKKSKKKKTDDKKKDGDAPKSKDGAAKKDDKDADATAGGADSSARSKSPKHKKKKSKDKDESGKEHGSGDEEEDDEMLWFISTDLGLSKKAAEMGYRPLKDAIITGVSGGIISEACTSTLPVIALISDSSSLSDVENATSIVQIIDNLLGRAVIDTKKLEAEIKRIKEQIDKAVEYIQSATRDKHKEAAQSMYL